MLNKRLIRLAKGRTKYIAANVAIQWASLLCNIVLIFSLGYLLQSLLNGTFTPLLLGIVAGIAALCIGARFVASILSAKMSYLSAEGVKFLLREKIYNKLLQLGPAYTSSVNTSEVLQVAVEGVDQLEIYFGKYLPQFFYSLLAPITLFAVLAFVNLPAALVLLACVPLIPVSIILVQKFAKKLLAKYWGSYTQLGDSFLENLQGLTTLKIYAADEAKQEEMHHEAENFRRITMRVLVMQLNSVTLMDLIAYGGAALGIVVAVTQLAAGNLAFAGCFAILLLASDFFIPLRLLGSFFHVAMNGAAASEKIFKLLDLPLPQSGNKTIQTPQPQIQLEALDFAYKKDRPILKNVSLQAGPGITALVGESGCGKSTIASLIMGRQNGYSGHLYVGETERSELEDANVMQNITLVSHNSSLFKGSVRANLYMGKPNASDEEMWAVLQQVALDAFLKEQNGLDTPLTEQGGNLSGGQRQRLALARSLLHNTPVYLFDEATSNIDAESENHIVSVIWQMAKTKTVLIISHRLANVVPASHIYLLQNGSIAEHGTHKTLMAQNGSYAAMFNRQQQLEQVGKKEYADA
ncbi:MAG: ABC transporter ATP-binding protein/permease [Oscillospiraceae bacterium]